MAAATFALVPVACGDEEGDDASAPELTAPVGESLPPELIGSWYELPVGNTKWRTTFMAADHEICLEVVRTRGACFLTEAASGGAVVQADDLGQPRLDEYGEVGIKGDELVFRVVATFEDRCEGSRRAATWKLRDERLVLEQTAAQCGEEEPITLRFDRAG